LIRAVEIDEYEMSADAKAPPRTQPLDKSSQRRVIHAPEMNGFDVLVQLLRIHNLIVILIIAALHILVVAWTIMLAGGLFFASIFGIFLISPILCQYSLIIQETGPAEKDELPAPLREFALREDVWDPFVHLFVSAVACFSAGGLWYFYGPDNSANDAITLVLLLAGAIFFPVVLMTAATDGILENFRPDRLVKVMGSAPISYLSVVLAFIGGGLVYLSGNAGLLHWAISLFHHSGAGPMEAPPWFVPGPLIGFWLALAGLYLLYFACWQLGLIWRKHHTKFPWIAQHFLKGPTPAGAAKEDGPKAA
jgi:hypothetical protein